MICRSAGKPLLVRYDLDGVAKALSKEELARRPADLWRYRELLPVRRTADIVSLGETVTPLIPLPRVAGAASAAASCWSRTKAGCRPARSRRAASSWRCPWRRRSASRIWRCRPTAMPERRWRLMRARAGIRTTIFCPEDTPEVNLSRNRDPGRHGLPRQRPDRRLRPDRRAGQGEGRLVRRLHSEGAVPDRGQEDHGAGTGRATRLGRARRDLLSDRRRHRPDRHVEGLRRNGGDRLHRRQASADGRGAGRRLRAHGAGLGGRRRACAALGECRTPSRPASACPRRSAIS